MSFLLITGILGISNFAFADEAEYQSNSGVGFYGEYVFPTDPPVDPPTTPNPGIIPPATGEKFPQTGETNNNLFSIGSLLLVVAFGMGIIIKNKQLRGEIK